MPGLAFFTALKSAPYWLIAALVLTLGGVYLSYDAANSKLKASLAQTQRDYALALQSNKSLELDILKRQKEFEASEKERTAIQSNDQTVMAASRKAKGEAQALADQSEVLKAKDPVDFLKQINEQANCAFDGFGNPPLCGEDKPKTPEAK